MKNNGGFWIRGIIITGIIVGVVIYCIPELRERSNALIEGIKNFWRKK